MNNFNELNEQELLAVDGGELTALLIVVVVAAAVVGIVVNEVVERTTGKDISGHIGSAFKAVGDALSD